MFSGGIKVGPRPNWNAPPGPTHTPRSLRFQTTAAWLWPTVAKLLRLRFPKKKSEKEENHISTKRGASPFTVTRTSPRPPPLREATDTNFAKLQRSSNAPHELEFSTNLQNLLFFLCLIQTFSPLTQNGHTAGTRVVPDGLQISTSN